MFKFPFVVLCYGDFKTERKLFAYDRHGTYTLPIFNDFGLAHKFATRMTDLLATNGDKRKLQPLVCSEPARALDMFRVLSVAAPDLYQVVVDPNPPGATLAEFSITERLLALEDVTEWLSEASADVKSSQESPSAE